jgi:hypothetical protein
MTACKAAIAAGAVLAIAFAGVAAAQTQKKSTPVTSLGEGEAILVSPKTGTVHKSNSKVSAAKHQAALAKGAKEISANTVIYKQGGKMYMFNFQDAANTQAAEDFQSQFDNE